MTDKLQARATVQVTLEIDTAGAGWNPDCTVDQVFRQASEGAIARLRALLAGTTTSASGCKISAQGIRVVGQPKICAIMMDSTPPSRLVVRAIGHAAGCAYLEHATLACTCGAKP